MPTTYALSHLRKSRDYAPCLGTESYIYFKGRRNRQARQAHGITIIYQHDIHKPFEDFSTYQAPYQAYLKKLYPAALLI